MNEVNRVGVVLISAAVIVLAAAVILLSWTEYARIVDAFGDFVEYLVVHEDAAAKVIITLGALTIAVIATLVIVIELSPQEDQRELRLEHGGTTTIVPADVLRLDIEEAILTLPAVTGARADVASHRGKIAVGIELTVIPETNVAVISQEATAALAHRLEEAGLPLSQAPRLHITFGKGPGHRDTGKAQSNLQDVRPAQTAGKESKQPTEGSNEGTNSNDRTEQRKEPNNESS